MIIIKAAVEVTLAVMVVIQVVGVAPFPVLMC